jgi:hypothetical protein
VAEVFSYSKGTNKFYNLPQQLKVDTLKEFAEGPHRNVLQTETDVFTRRPERATRAGFFVVNFNA